MDWKDVPTPFEPVSDTTCPPAPQDSEPNLTIYLASRESLGLLWYLYRGKQKAQSPKGQAIFLVSRQQLMCIWPPCFRGAAVAPSCILFVPPSSSRSFGVRKYPGINGMTDCRDVSAPNVSFWFKSMVFLSKWWFLMVNLALIRFVYCRRFWAGLQFIFHAKPFLPFPAPRQQRLQIHRPLRHLSLH
jgi:hypothetical protein